MIKPHLFLFCCLANMAFSQSADYTKAPNSYIYDLDLAHSYNYGGIEIPVKKAYEMWEKYEYLKSDGSFTPIPEGNQTASLYWEDVRGLVDEVVVLSNADPSQSKIKIKINKGKGKGNAVVAFKVDGKIYWSWHIWVTDNPENGVQYSQGFETDIDGNLVSIKYMDRNLGATTNDFLGNQWQKSGGLMYEWGRKDPFPGLMYKDSHFYEISGEVGVLRHPQVDKVNTIPVKVRPYDEIEKNIQYSVNNPITYIINTDNAGNWFSSSRYKVSGETTEYVTWDLWADNAKGKMSNGNSSNATLKAESRSYELKSELDPCPNGWRIPSYYGRETHNNNLSFFGSKNWNNDDAILAHRQFFPDSQNPILNGIKIYPGLGLDFSNAAGGARNIGLLSVSGGYVYYPNVVAPNSPVGTVFQDNHAIGGLWSSTFGYDGGRIFSMVSDSYRTNTSTGLHAIYNNQTNPSKSGNAVKCIKDPNLLKIGNFATQYFTNNKENFTTGIDTPNSYVVVNQSELQIPVSKAFSVYNQLLSNQEMPPSDNLLVKILWTTNPNLVTDVELELNATDARLSVIKLQLNSSEKGNAVVSLHNGSTGNPVLWSWHIWATDEDPNNDTISYTTEVPIATSYNFINPTNSKLPPLKTVFMNKNLGAESKDLDSGVAFGLHYQWGRKDPIPNFPSGDGSLIYVDSDNGRNNISHKFSFNYKEVNNTAYENNYTDAYDTYAVNHPLLHQKTNEHVIYSVKNPLRFMYQSGVGEIYDGGDHYGNDLTKIKDWVSNEKAAAENRWAHGDKKSPFDPCPQGWRVPDVSFAHLFTGSKGNSPWYNSRKADAYGRPGVIQDQWHGVENFYAGSQEGDKGWKFESPSYFIGSFPKDGIRGELGSNKLAFERSGVWTASLADLNTGYALGMQFEGNKMQTGTGVYPQAGMSVRCAKDEPRLLNSPVIPDITLSDEDSFGTSFLGKGNLQVYPNPFKDDFYIDHKEANGYEIYDFSGRLVQKGNVLHGKISAPKMQNGFYILKILMSDGSFITKKLIKE